jgi:hypothetical protein
LRASTTETRGIGAEGEQLLLVGKTVFEAPELGAAGVDQQMQATAIGELVWLVPRLGAADGEVGQARANR